MMKNETVLTERPLELGLTADGQVLYPSVNTVSQALRAKIIEVKQFLARYPRPSEYGQYADFGVELNEYLCSMNIHLAPIGERYYEADLFGLPEHDQWEMSLIAEHDGIEDISQQPVPAGENLLDKVPTYYDYCLMTFYPGKAN